MEAPPFDLSLEERVALGLGADIDFPDESEVLFEEVDAACSGHPILPRSIDVLDAAAARADAAQRAVGRQTAELWAAVHETLTAAEADPSAVLDPHMRVSDVEARDYAVRAVVAELAVRLNLSETAVRTIGEHTRRLVGCRRTWTAFRAGRISPQNVRVIAAVLGNLPVDCWTEFDTRIVEPAARMAAGRFRRTAHALRDRIHRTSVATRHAEAAADRRVVLEHDLDGMSWLSLHLRSEIAVQAHGMIDNLAHHLSRTEGESRTLEQLRADIAADILLATGTGDQDLGDRARPGVQLVVTVPAATLLGGDAPGVLDGVGAIDAVTARDLAALGSSFAAAIQTPGIEDGYRIAPAEYRLPEALKRRLRFRDRTCWRPALDPDTDTVTWTSPTGFEVDSDPPPF